MPVSDRRPVTGPSGQRPSPQRDGLTGAVASLCTLKTVPTYCGAVSRRGDSRRLPPGISIRAHQVEAALDDVARRVPGAKPDGWLPSVQGAVGHVVGIKLSSIDDRLGDRGAAVLKVYGAHGAARAPVEASVLRQLDGWTVLPTPRLLATGSVDGLPWVLMTRLEGVRWVDYMQQYGAAAQVALIQATARVLRVLHARPGPAFGGILPGDEPPVSPVVLFTAVA